MKQVLALLVCLFAGSAQAAFVFTTSGEVVDNTGGSFTASTGGGATAAADVEIFLGLASGSLQGISTSLSGNPVTEASALKASMAVVVGDQVSFDWIFSTLEELVPVNPTFPPADQVRDFGFYSVKILTSGGPTLLADALIDNTGASGAVSFTVVNAGTLEIGVGVVDVDDIFGESFMNASNFVLVPFVPPTPPPVCDPFTQNCATVPAPATLALFGLGLAGLGWSRRRKA